MRPKEQAHDHKEFLAKAKARKGFLKHTRHLSLSLRSQAKCSRRSLAGLTQDVMAERMGTTKSAVSRLESAGKHAPSLETLKRYAGAVGCELQVCLVMLKQA